MTSRDFKFIDPRTISVIDLCIQPFPKKALAFGDTHSKSRLTLHVFRVWYQLHDTLINHKNLPEVSLFFAKKTMKTTPNSDEFSSFDGFVKLLSRFFFLSVYLRRRIKERQITHLNSRGTHLARFSSIPSVTL